MDIKGKKQSSNIIDATTPSGKALLAQEARGTASKRLLRTDDSIAYNNDDKTPTDFVTSVMKNPGKASVRTAMNANKGKKDPPAQVLDATSRSNYDDIPFFEHKTVDNVYKEPR